MKETNKEEKLADSLTEEFFKGGVGIITENCKLLSDTVYQYLHSFTNNPTILLQSFSCDYIGCSVSFSGDAAEGKIDFQLSENLEFVKSDIFESKTTEKNLIDLQDLDEKTYEKSFKTKKAIVLRLFDCLVKENFIVKWNAQQKEKGIFVFHAVRQVVLMTFYPQMKK